MPTPAGGAGPSRRQMARALLGISSSLESTRLRKTAAEWETPMGYGLLFTLIAVALVLVFLVSVGRNGRGKPQKDADPGRPEDRGTSYEKPQDEGPQ